MSAISLAEWGPRMEAGEITFAVGPVPGPCAVYLDRAETAAAADEIDGRYIEWVGHTGHQVSTPEAQAAAEAYTPEPELEAEL